MRQDAKLFDKIEVLKSKQGLPATVGKWAARPCLEHLSLSLPSDYLYSVCPSCLSVKVLYNRSSCADPQSFFIKAGHAFQSKEE